MPLGPRSTVPSDTSRAFPNDSECYETCDEIVYHVPPNFNISVGQEHRHVLIIPGKKSDYECRCSEYDVSDIDEDKLTTIFGVAVFLIYYLLQLI